MAASNSNNIIIYPPGCEEIQKDMPADVLLKRLNKLASWSKAAEAPEGNNTLYLKYIPLLLHLSNGDFFNHSSKDIQLLVACSIADLIRLQNPKPPYDDIGQLKAVMNFFIGQLKNLEKTNSSFDTYWYLLVTLAAGNSYHLCFYLPSPHEFLCSLFEVIFQGIKRNRSSNHRDSMCAILCDLVSEWHRVYKGSSIPPELLNIIVKYVTEPSKSTNKEAFELAKELITECWKLLQNSISDFLNKETSEESFVCIRAEINSLIADLNLETEEADEVCPDGLQTTADLIVLPEDPIREEDLMETYYLDDLPTSTDDDLRSSHSSLIYSPNESNEDNAIVPSANISEITVDTRIDYCNTENVNEQETQEILYIQQEVPCENERDILEAPLETVVTKESLELDTSQKHYCHEKGRRILPRRLAKHKGGDIEKVAPSRDINKKTNKMGVKTTVAEKVSYEQSSSQANNSQEMTNPNQSKRSLRPRPAKQSGIQNTNPREDNHGKNTGSIQIDAGILGNSLETVNSSKIHLPNVKSKPNKNGRNSRINGKTLRQANKPKADMTQDDKKGVEASPNCLKKRKISSKCVITPRWYPTSLGYICNFCGKKHGDLTKLDEHIRSHTSEKPYKCSKCIRQYPSQTRLTLHQKDKHSTKRLVCKYCGLTFGREYVLNIHMRWHTASKNDRPFKCDLCPATFFSSADLKRHIPIHSEERPFRCDICHATFKLEWCFKKHKAVHSDERPFSCSICNRAFSRLSYLQSHKLTHTKERAHQCDHCDKAFVNKFFLKQHRTMHTGEKPYQCEICNKRFSQWRHLHHHKMLHKDKNAFTCDICGKKFGEMGTLRGHKRAHLTNAKCNICRVTFGHWVSYKRHLKRHCKSSEKKSFQLRRKAQTT